MSAKFEKSRSTAARALRVRRSPHKNSCVAWESAQPNYNRTVLVKETLTEFREQLTVYLDETDWMFNATPTLPLSSAQQSASSSL